MEVWLTYPTDQCGLIGLMLLKMDSKHLFASLVLLLSRMAFSEGVLSPYTPSLSVHFETTSRIL